MPDTTAARATTALDTIALAAGGTGGHVFPAEALARELMRRGHRMVLYTDRRGAQYAQALQGIDTVVLPARSLAGGPVGKLAAAATIARAACAARADLKRRGARAMVGFGGYPSFAPALAVRSLGLPLLLHEQTSRISVANAKLLRFASGVALSFADTAGVAGIDAARLHVTGNPVRTAVLAARAPYPALDDAAAPLRLLVVGGSQGAGVFGRVVPSALQALPQALRQRLHVGLQYKGEDAGGVAETLRASGIASDVRPFFEDMGAQLAAAHLVVTRAGASTIADLLAMGRPALYVPIPQGGSATEQSRNAQSIAEAGAGWCVPETQFDAAALSCILQDLFADPARLRAAAQAASALGRPDAAQRLADLVEQALPRP